MSVLIDKLNERIALEDREIARIQTDGQAAIQAAKRRKGILEAAKAKLVAQPDLENLIALLAEVGVKVTE